IVSHIIFFLLSSAVINRSRSSAGSLNRRRLHGNSLMICSVGGDEPAAQALRHALSLRIVNRGIDEVAAHQPAANPLFEAADAKDFLTGDTTVPRLAAATPCLFPHVVLDHVALAGCSRAEAAVG